MLHTWLGNTHSAPAAQTFWLMSTRIEEHLRRLFSTLLLGWTVGLGSLGLGNSGGQTFPTLILKALGTKTLCFQIQTIVNLVCRRQTSPKKRMNLIIMSNEKKRCQIVQGPGVKSPDSNRVTFTVWLVFCHFRQTFHRLHKSLLTRGRKKLTGTHDGIHVPIQSNVYHNRSPFTLNFTLWCIYHCSLFSVCLF